jgi:hypothetical protein
LQELSDLHKELEKGEEAAKFAADLKKAKVGLINLQAYMNQVDCIEFAKAINNQVWKFVRIEYVQILAIFFVQKFVRIVQVRVFKGFSIGLGDLFELFVSVSVSVCELND